MNQHPWIQCKSDRGFLPHSIGIRSCSTKPLLEDDIWWNSNRLLMKIVCEWTEWRKDVKTKEYLMEHQTTPSWQVTVAMPAGNEKATLTREVASCFANW